MVYGCWPSTRLSARRILQHVPESLIGFPDPDDQGSDCRRALAAAPGVLQPILSMFLGFRGFGFEFAGQRML
jgi:hypothetical protein